VWWVLVWVSCGVVCARDQWGDQEQRRLCSRPGRAALLLNLGLSICDGTGPWPQQAGARKCSAPPVPGLCLRLREGKCAPCESRGGTAFGAGCAKH